MHGNEQASPWIRRWAHLIAPGAAVLDVACGSGRHLRFFHERGHPVTGVDRDAAATAGLREFAEIVVADIEQGPWPLPGRRFGAVVVTHYLWRPLFPHLLASLAEGGVLLYETFTLEQARIGRPSNPQFLLESGELLRLTQGLRVVAFEDGFLTDAPRFVQRVAAVRSAPAGSAAARLALDAPA